MMTVLIVISSVLFISNILFLVLLYRKSKKPPIQITKDANQLLSELLTGGAVVTVQVVNPAEVFTWSPKDGR